MLCYGYVAALTDSMDSGDKAAPFQATIFREMFSDSGKPRTSTKIPGASYESTPGLAYLRYGGLPIQRKCPTYIANISSSRSFFTPPSVIHISRPPGFALALHFLLFGAFDYQAVHSSEGDSS